MKVTAVLVSTLAVATAFAPAPAGRTEMSLSAEKKSVASRIFDMDLFAPVKDQNDYGARSKKKLGLGKLGNNAYVPDGLTKSQYEKIRNKDQSKIDSNYARNVAKKFKFIDFTDWYLKRGTDVSESWVKTTGRGHTFAKTKYDFSGNKDEAKSYDGRK